MQGMYSMRSPAVKRLMKEAQELSEATEQYYCQPLEDNLFEWHFTIRGPADTEFEGGLYHGRIVLPADYPMKPPSIILLTNNGRFETNKKICLSISGHHPESWQPSWSIRTALLAIIGFMPTHGAGALGSLDYSQEERKGLARRSVDFKCPDCGPINHTLKAVTEESIKTIKEAQQLAAQMDFKDEKERNAALKETTTEPQATTDTEATDTAPEEAQSPPTGAIPKVQTAQQPFTQPMQYGQLPMQMPFMPPFPMPGNVQTNQQQNNILNRVPRFPLPFAAPMSSPYVSFMPPMMPGMNFPPLPPGNVTMGTPVVDGNAAVNFQVPTTPTSIPSNQSPTNSVPSTVSSTTHSNSDTQASTESSPSISATSSLSTTTPTSASSESVTMSTSTQQEATSTSANEGLRQRNIPGTEAVNSSPRARVSNQPQPAPIVPRPSQRESPIFIAFAVIIISLIAVLLLRRLYIMKYLSGLL